MVIWGAPCTKLLLMMLALQGKFREFGTDKKYGPGSKVLHQNSRRLFEHAGIGGHEEFLGLCKCG